MSDMSGDRHPPSFPTVGGNDTLHDADATIFTPAARKDDATPGATEPGELVPADPVSSAGHGGRYRWAVAGIATIAVVAILAGLVLFAGPRPGTPSAVAHFAPADVSAYFEARLDLPGDQRDKLATFMSHFPGFADQASFELKLDETLNSLLRSSGSGLDWARDIEPWFGGQVAIFGTEPVDAEIMTSPANLTIVLTVTDRPALEAIITQTLGERTTSDEDFNGVTIRTLEDNSDPELSFAVTHDALIAATGRDRVEAALDVRADRVTGLADDDFFLLQLGSLHADRLATMYFEHDPSVATDVLEGLPTDLPGRLPINLPANCASELTSAGTVRAVAELRAEDDRMTLTTRARPAVSEGLPLPVNEPSVLAASVPADSVAYVEIRQLGASISHRLGRLLDCVGQLDGGFDLGQLERFLGASPENYFDFIDDAAIAVGLADGRPTGGLVATVDDETVARTRLERLLSAIRALAGLGGGISVTEEEHGPATLTVVTVEEGLSADGQASTSFAITVANGRLYAGLGDFVAQALDRTAADSLAGNPKFSATLNAGGPTNAGIGYLDVARLRALIEEHVPSGDPSHYQTEVQPFVRPLSHFSFVARTENDVVVSNVFLYVE